MDILITHGGLARTRSMHVRPVQLWLIVITLVLLLMLLSGAIYHFVFLKAAREGWPVVSQVVGLVVRDEFEQRDRYMRENLDAMAQRVGEMQAKVIRLEAVGARVSGLAGLKPEELRALDEAGKEAAAQASAPPAAASAVPAAAKVSQASASRATGLGGPYLPASPSPSLQQLNDWIDQVDADADLRNDVFTLVESRLLERKLEQLVVPSMAPVSGPVGSGFGFRYDPFTGRAALHTGLDFPAPSGTAIHAAAGGKVVAAEWDGAYGQALMIDHGNGLVTRYAHTSAILVKPGELVRRGQRVAQVGSTGRSTGSHLHFEVLLGGVPQNPARFLARGERLDDTPATARADAAPARAGGQRARAR
ncbi:murein DD-endopeptidase MepM/ murein hydrolase activator NlpD [Sphaerotilus hippei]|uniref:Murein DD-endopeptidase MepM/ murein hydrolase activator NlpD n=1 Tax=Sphaerotilus hippei TaxID=744406 RepID=A0A318H5Y1_9BURK|nr:M23 family metallopeptidase [Sphaerotilus hippei]PXW94594.1 murein DD-endopeptidase MepM/ murein hydrolase activator NlpD [Sphaerotilus hippei]